MAYLPGFDHDIFISYAHHDNQKGDDDAVEWVTQFHEMLELKLRNRLSKRVSIWRDRNEVRGNDLFDPKIEEAIKGSGLLVALNSEAYADSKYCRRELEQFYAKAKSERWGVDIRGRKRVFQVKLNNISPTDLHPAFDGAGGYDFYSEKQDGNVAQPVKTNAKAFTEGIESLAVDLAGMLRAFKTAIWLKRIAAIGIGILVLGVVVGAVYLIMIEPKPDCDTAEESISLSSGLQQWEPSGIGWNVGPAGEAYGWRIKGDAVGLFKTANTTNPYNRYCDFTLELDVRFIGKKGVAWVVRAQDFDNYYLFELTRAEGAYPVALNFYKVINGERTWISSARPEVNVEDDQDNFLITTEAKGRNFAVTVRPALYDAPGSQRLKTFTDSTFSRGGVGLLPRDGREVLLQQLRVEPHQQAN